MRFAIHLEIFSAALKSQPRVQWLYPSIRYSPLALSLALVTNDYDLYLFQGQISSIC
jgi:hypothetical protein